MNLLNRKFFPLAALLWAVLLLALSAVMGGAGHGLLFPMVITCAPLPVGYGPSLGVLAIPLSVGFWFLVARGAVRSKPWVCPTLLAVHYVLAVAGFALVFPDDFKDPNRDPKKTLAAAAVWLTAWGVLYLAGQIALWWAWHHESRRRNGDYHKRTPWPPHPKPKSSAKSHSPRRARA